jgi:hypothetical protein
MVGASDDFRSRVEEYVKGLEGLLVDAQSAIDRQAPDVLDKMAAAARDIAQRLDQMASDARHRAEEREPTPEPARSRPGSAPESEAGPEPLTREEALAEDAATEGEEPSAE